MDRKVRRGRFRSHPGRLPGGMPDHRSGPAVRSEQQPGWRYIRRSSIAVGGVQPKTLPNLSCVEIKAPRSGPPARARPGLPHRLRRWLTFGTPPGFACFEIVVCRPARHHFTTRNVRCVTPAPSITRVLSSSIGSALWSNNRTPSPSRTGTRSRCISSRSPDLMHCCTRFAPITPTSLSPAAAFACATALSRPSVTNVKDDPWFTHSCGTEWVRTKTGTPKGCPPPHPRVRSNVLRPVTKAPVVVLVSRRYSAVCGATLNTISVPGSLYSVSPPMYHAKSRSPPLPIGASGPSFGPAINPSSDVACPVRTFAMAFFS
jgi:hypothetical protein